MKSLARQMLLQAAVATIVAALVLLTYERWRGHGPAPIGVVDLNAVYRQKEAEFTHRVTQARTDAEREQAMRDARTFAQRLPLALQALPEECHCLVVLSSAVVLPAHGAVDLTPSLHQKLDAQ